VKLQSEKQLQEAIVELLGYKGITPIRNRMDKPTSNNVGTPDLLFAICGQAVAWEIKLPKNKITQAQLHMHDRLGQNGWSLSIIHSLDEAMRELARLSDGPQHTPSSYTRCLEAKANE
jgi:hypothetical protein